jgi:lysophospholipase L1-like esterase
MFQRYVAIGDSSTEGLNDDDGSGGFRGWADRLAAAVAETSPDLAYANLAVRGRLVGQVRAEQLPRAVQLAPDLATVFAGVNDVMRPRYDADRVLGDLEACFTALRATGATVLTITCPDPGRGNVVALPLRRRLLAYNDGVREAAARTGVLCADVAANPVASDQRLWSSDRLHANSAGHERIAAALAERLGLPRADHGWAADLPPLSRPARRARAADELRWWREHCVPYLVRHARGRSLGDDVTPKRPDLRPLDRGLRMDG